MHTVPPHLVFFSASRVTIQFTPSTICLKDVVIESMYIFLPGHAVRSNFGMGSMPPLIH